MLKNWFKNRINTQKWTGMSLTLLTLGFIYITLLLTGIIEEMVEQDSIVQLDHQLAYWINIYRPDSWVMPFTVITYLGKLPAVLMVVLTTLVGLWQLKLTQWITPFLISLLSAGLLAELGKWFFERPRPIEALYYESSYSFPSGHATLSIALYGFIALIFYVQSSKHWQKNLSIILGFSLAFLIGLSRLVLDVHYLSDVLAGFLVGSLSALLGLSVYLWQRSHQHEK
jgi:membrane-associated phospholipid phosphatase